MVELRDDLEMDMPKWVEEMKEVLVESVDWAMCPTAMKGTDSWMDFQNKVPAAACLTEDGTEVETEVVTSVAIARLPFAWAHTIEGRTAALVVLVGQERPDQLGCVQARGIWIGPTLPWLRRKGRFGR